MNGATLSLWLIMESVVLWWNVVQGDNGAAAQIADNVCRILAVGEAARDAKRYRTAL